MDYSMQIIAAAGRIRFVKRGNGQEAQGQNWLNEAKFSQAGKEGRQSSFRTGAN
jgi:hypothetical protein